MAMTTIKLFDGDFGSDQMFLRCNLWQAASTIEYSVNGDDWSSTRYQCADARQCETGLAAIGKLLAAGALEIPRIECKWIHV